MAGIKDAIVDILGDNADVAAWATGGIHARRAPPMPTTASSRRRNNYIVVRVSDSDPNESHTQDGPAKISKDTLDVSIWASSSRDADEGANRVRVALDGMTGEAAGITIQRIFWRGTVDREAEDASEAEQLIDGAHAEFEVDYTLP